MSFLEQVLWCAGGFAVVGALIVLAVAKHNKWKLRATVEDLTDGSLTEDVRETEHEAQDFAEKAEEIGRKAKPVRKPPEK